MRNGGGLLLHGTNLHRRGMGAQQQTVAQRLTFLLRDHQRILRVARRVTRRKIQRSRSCNSQSLPLAPHRPSIPSRQTRPRSRSSSGSADAPHRQTRRVPGNVMSIASALPVACGCPESQRGSIAALSALKRLPTSRPPRAARPSVLRSPSSAVPACGLSSGHAAAPSLTQNSQQMRPAQTATGFPERNHRGSQANSR